MAEGPTVTSDRVIRLTASRVRSVLLAASSLCLSLPLSLSGVSTLAYAQRNVDESPGLRLEVILIYLCMCESSRSRRLGGGRPSGCE